MDTSTNIDPVKYLMDEALRVLNERRPNFPKESLEYRTHILEEYKRVTLRRSLCRGYYLWTMFVHHVPLSIQTPLRYEANLHYNPLKDCS